jgi:hypothetical protein
MSSVRENEKDPNSNLTIESVESLVNMIERYPELSKNQQNLKSVIELIFKNMIEIED